MAAETSYDVIVVGGTPGGLMASIAAARRGQRVLLLERDQHLGGLPANGLGATDIGTRGATGGLFLEFVTRVKAHYVATYGAASPQVKDCSDGYHFEPHVAEQVFEQMLGAQPTITVLRRRQFDALPANVVKEAGALVGLSVTNRATGAVEQYRGRVFIDATYEGDLAAAAGAPFRTRREGADEYKEPRAGRLYIAWGAKQPGAGSTGAGDDCIQAFNYRLCLTSNPANRVDFAQPKDYRRDEYVSLVEDVRTGRHASLGDPPRGIAWLTNMVTLPNGKTDANNQHAVFLSTDLPEENWPWPTADWAWRDRFAQRLRDYICGLFWFAQHDEALPAEFRAECARWGLAADEYGDNGHFPRQVYVREGRRIEGEHLFTAHDAQPLPNGRPPIYADSVTASHYALDSHACHKREADREHLDGFFSYPSRPYTVPYGAILPRGVDNLLTPVPASATHVGFSTLRMEPCWMALGQAAGTAAALSLERGTTVRGVARGQLQEALLAAGAMLIYYRDVPPTHPAFAALQRAGLRGLVIDWEARLDQPVADATAQRWLQAAGRAAPGYQPGRTTAGELLLALFGQG